MIVKKDVLEKINYDQSIIDYKIFVNQLMSIYNAEKKLNLLLPKMILNAKSPEIANVFEKHLKFSKKHIVRLESLFINSNKPIKRKS